ncbi:peptide deformylase [Roseisalinus antarcticus]|uniref:Peptide deformylase-like n=1 Tax=Roseisalinus antarcticus TaxID=254357 RepID=A0A1Y5SNN6_9RHOB|nr:peptide deformylase [Roseisalinus antarcticus]SLN44714.1 Peptide deformylase 1 [Roseisalinus antarcticus]
MSRPFVIWPHKALRTPAAPVPEVTEEVRSVWDEMVAAMEAMPGYGLAAPQLGIGLRLAVVDASRERGRVVRLANPRVLHASVELREHEEASPNLPGVSAVVTRPRDVTVEFLNAEGQPEERDFVGLWATSVQHQIDHLDGRMYFDRVSRTKRDMLLKRARKIGH